MVGASIGSQLLVGATRPCLTTSATIGAHWYILVVEGERFGPIDFDSFHREHLPALLSQRGPGLL